ncbi:MAG: phosphoglucosamine mutase [Clostridiales bacterium]|nr:phosphoglucosamine mutase [Clostridiales bacterium]
MGKYFGTDGFRGEANKNLTAEHAFRIGRFLGSYLTKKKGEKAKIVIGKDTRRSGYMFEYALSAGLVSSGADAYLLHVTTTPSVAFVTRTEGFDAGVMISASHNPFYDNGIKLFNEHGEKMDEETIEKIEAELDKIPMDGGEYQPPPYATGERIGRTVDYVAGRNRYVGYLISLGVYSFKGIKVGLDCANGSAWEIAKTVFDSLGAKTYVTGAEPDGTNVNKGVGSTHIENLQSFVLEKGLDVGFAYDGDADRCLCVDEKGQIVDGDQILYLYGRYLYERGKLRHNTVVTTVMSNFGLYKAFDEIGISYEKTPVGDKYVYERMANGGFSLGGEKSGHIIFSKYATTGDGILTSLKIMQAMIDRKSALSQLVAPMKAYPQVLKNVRVTDKSKTRADKDVCAVIERVAKSLGDSGRVLVRESGTEPVIRVMVEGENEPLCQRFVEEIVSVIQEKGYVSL